MALKFSDADMKDLDNLDANTTEKREFPKIPTGDYEVRLHSVKCKTCEPDDYHPEEFYRAVVTFRILAGNYAGEYTSYVQTLDKVWQIKLVNKFLKSMKTDVDLSSARFVVDGEFNPHLYQEILEEVYDDITTKEFEYQLSITPQAKNPKFNDYTIVGTL